MKGLVVILALLAGSLALKSQVLPQEGTKLHYRIVGFAAPAVQDARQYILEVARGTYYSDDSFKKNIVVTVTSGKPRLIAELPEFGCDYTWRLVGIVRHASVAGSTFRHFSTVKIPAVDTSDMRVRMLKKSESFGDNYIFLDGNRALYDMNGHPVWYVPLTDKLYAQNIDPRDLKITSRGTMTLLVGEQGYEIDYSGNILWSAPDPLHEHYHHELTRLSNGNYMILGYEAVNIYVKKTPQQNESGLVIVPDSSAQNTAAKNNPALQFLRPDQFSQIIEYNPNGKIIHTYKPSQYFNGSDLYFRKTENGNIYTKVHNNGFFLDEKKGILYLSFKEIDRVVKIKYPEGKVLDAYGDNYAPGAAQNKGKGFFCRQHHCALTDEGYLSIYNNNTCYSPSLPSVVLMQEPATTKDSIKKVWEFICPVDELTEEERKTRNFTAGGSVYELPDHSLFVNMGGDYPKLFIVNRNKEILWSALPEKWQPQLNKWWPFSQYRASIINREQLEKMVWYTEMKK